MARTTSRREAILAAASALIAERGLAGLSMAAVARQAGVTPGLLYYHFGSRVDLVRAALHYANDRGPSMNLLRAGEGRNGFEAVRAALLAEFDDAPQVRDLNVIWNEVGASAVFDPTVRVDLTDVITRWNDTVAVGILRGIADGSVRPDVDATTAADTLTALVEGLSQQWLAHTTTLAEARATLTDAVTRLLANPDALVAHNC